MNNKNVILIVVDAVRSYKTGKDEKDRLNIYDNLTDQGFISLDKLVVSAPSSLMSSITMLTGIPSYALGQTYTDFKWEPDLYDVVPDLLSKNGYEIFGLFGTKEMRDRMKGIFPPIKKNLLANKLNTRQRKWSNKELLETIKNYFKSKTITQNFFLMTWFNSRFDNQTSETIEEFINFLQNNNYLDNSLIILTADHGYPDMIRGLTSDGSDLKKSGKPHDLIVTDDNICVPTAIKFPNNYHKINSIKSFSNKIRIKKVISQEVLTPTILDVLGIKKSSDKLLRYKRNDMLSELKNNFTQPIRSDARFIFQPNRITSIRTDKLKYINDKDNKEEYFYDLESDPGETKKNFNINSKDVCVLKELYYFQEKESTHIWLEKIKNSLNKINLSKMIDSDNTINLIFLGKSVFIIPFIKHMQKYNKKISLYLFDLNLASNIEQTIDCNGVNLKLLRKINKNNGIVVIEDVNNLSFIDRFKDIDIKNILIIDTMLNLSTSKFKMILKSKIKFALGPFNRMYLRRELYSNDYLLLLSDLMYLIKRSLQIIFLKIVRK